MSLLPLDEAQARLLALAVPLEGEQIDITQAAGRYLAVPLAALRSQPAANLSAMDGYAIRWADMPGPWSLIGESAAGHQFPGSIAAGQCVRISTGAVLPKEADSVVVQEDVERIGDEVFLRRDGPDRSGKHVRPAGQDFAAGDMLLDAGDEMTAARVALAIMAGHGWVETGRLPHVVILNSGDELVTPGRIPDSADQIPASNALMLAAMLNRLPCTVTIGAIIPDSASVIADAIREHDKADIIVTTGGASVGDHDQIVPALENLGAAPDFWRVAMKPGKPILAARLGKAVMLGLPGNPVSAFVTAMLFLLPLIRYLAGASQPLPAVRHAPLGTALPAGGSRLEFLRATLGDGVLHPLTSQDSAALGILAKADALIVRPINAPPALNGEIVQFLPL
ncbi:MAG: molybdopterin molybdotransferase MoeA [Blastomonas sp.]